MPTIGRYVLKTIWFIDFVETNFNNRLIPIQVIHDRHADILEDSHTFNITSQEMGLNNVTRISKCSASGSSREGCLFEHTGQHSGYHPKETGVILP